MTQLLDVPDERFTDGDLRRRPELMHLAVEFLEQYRGEFEYLRTARYNLRVTGAISITEARGVLNCMRNDWDWQPRIRELLATVVSSPRPPVLKLVPPPKVVPVKLPPRSVQTRVHYNHTWLYSIHDRALIAHVVHDGKSHGTWWRETNAFTFHPVTWCQSRFSRMTIYPAATLRVGPDLPADRRPCVRCQNRIEVADA